ncbi:Bax inhibitor-1 family protein [Candidatus Nanohalovita haloferacivicina]|uniref:Bax inhibitor-1 family protein n=1 Tax=Candidatus Nanohalovita haloferacivicina TaxID=2978046 RepID=UPI00325FB6AA|nr:putative membrane protein [Candidatus Nanohalobia archaeon BNXNv]
MKTEELKSIGLSAGLILINIAVMWVFAFTPLSTISNIVFSTFILGVIFYGALLTGGVYLAKKGIRNNQTKQAWLGTAILQITYGIFGAGILGMIGPRTQMIALAATAIITTAITVISGLLVYLTEHDFSSWQRYSNYLFMGVLGISFIGTFSRGLIIVAFALALAGFLTYLVYEIWDMKQRPSNVYLNGIGIYVAFMGVFVQILQIVIEMLADR